MKKYIALIMLALALVACDKKEAEEPTTDEPAAEETAAEEADEESAEAPEETAEGEGAAEGSADTVEVAEAGTKFDPPVEADQLPEGAWYCDMGTVHYARMEKGDGKCAVCGMKLKQ